MSRLSHYTVLLFQSHSMTEEFLGLLQVTLGPYLPCETPTTLQEF